MSNFSSSIFQIENKYYQTIVSSLSSHKDIEIEEYD